MLLRAMPAKAATRNVKHLETSALDEQLEPQPSSALATMPAINQETFQVAISRTHRPRCNASIILELTSLSPRRRGEGQTATTCQPNLIRAK
jgi:hypothetical protein